MDKEEDQTTNIKDREAKGRQRSRNLKREENRDPGIMESSNLTDAEFRTIVIKMLNELRRSVDEFSENFNKEIKKNIKMEMEIIKGNQSEMKNTISEMKSIFEGINRVEEEEDRNSNREDGEAKDLSLIHI